MSLLRRLFGRRPRNIAYHMPIVPSTANPGGENVVWVGYLIVPKL